ncbi:MAG: hypothetical protein EWV53_01475 [Microcystis panniformis Mp_MB_F_20051200_S9]|uniref:Uncharacterized protein n=1 Tax=Microcystis panniformis Mp_MB_F_20051200_S9 TaxID=2486223 RepID=A0A552QAH4_9CHRO|nr:MAG: hypothetical protein EWV43_21490 [Microcystis panniformis Mp_MB_F_20080800_S26D]TRV45408.1 MAG: hypothetical protein EWV87_17555 [Microcystis panniformis Mp_GB_SS_20050300_S99]TRV50106.1 MAG: hypothetical protein EWV42_11870 [Microcystis panniformis Mp_GB_SS_20050300_S99D]TRV59737.1 MAG: hypothetical protein EWV69_11170 [Microcystis panniformis Mp_MB_F_20080800_S26]TRV64514.1 MAG: hypothetical protein EWV86_10510 [Microcystis panniformis Mp_MB_F_20051200_S9D]TRV66220.1 MAG: hypothetica
MSLKSLFFVLATTSTALTTLVAFPQSSFADIKDTVPPVSENKDFLIAQSDQAYKVYRCINQRNETWIVPGITGAWVRNSSCYIPVELGRCMNRTLSFNQPFRPCNKTSDSRYYRKYYQIGLPSLSVPFIIY